MYKRSKAQEAQIEKLVQRIEILESKTPCKCTQNETSDQEIVEESVELTTPRDAVFYKKIGTMSGKVSIRIYKL